METKGGAIMDSGATVMCSSTAAAEEIQTQRLRRSEPGDPSVRGSDRCFRFADGRTDDAQNMVGQPTTAGLLQGKTINMHLVDRNGNETSPLFSIDDQRRHRMVVDYEERGYVQGQTWRMAHVADDQKRPTGDPADERGM